MTNHVLEDLKYSYLWNKYRPVVLKLMKDASKKPQQYKFLKHEFNDINPREKGGHSFEMELSNGRPNSAMKASMVAQSLFAVLDQSMTAMDLAQGAIYEFSMDKQYNLEVTLKEAPQEEEVEQN